MSAGGNSRRTLLAKALEMQPGTMSIPRNTVEAALWQVIGWDTNGDAVGRLMSLVDAYADDCARRAITTWVRHGRGGEEPPPASAAQLVAVRQQLRVISMSPSVADATANEVRTAMMRSSRLSDDRQPVAAQALPSSRHLSVVPRQEHHQPQQPRRDDTGNANTSLSPVEHPESGNMSILSRVLMDAGLLEDSEGANRKYQCTGECKKLLTRDFFYRDSSRKTGIATKCKECKKTENTRYRVRKAEKAAVRIERLADHSHDDDRENIVHDDSPGGAG